MSQHNPPQLPKIVYFLRLSYWLALCYKLLSRFPTPHPKRSLHYSITFRAQADHSSELTLGLAFRVQPLGCSSFIDLIIDYLTQNGVMDPSLLYEAPFTDYSSKGLDGIFSDPDASGIVSILNSIHQAAVA